MNNKIEKPYLTTIESKNKLSKQDKQTQKHGCGKLFDGCHMVRGLGGWVNRLGVKKYNLQSQNSYGDTKYSIRNGVAKELMHKNLCIPL